MTAEQLRSFFEEQGFNVYPFEEDGQPGAEIEKWTDGGVDMIIVLNPFTVESFFEYVDSFDIDEEIETHRYDRRYREAFTIRKSLSDFTAFHRSLKKTKVELQKLK